MSKTGVDRSPALLVVALLAATCGGSSTLGPGSDGETDSSDAGWNGDAGGTGGTGGVGGAGGTGGVGGAGGTGGVGGAGGAAGAGGVYGGASKDAGPPTSLVGPGQRKPNVVVILADDLGYGNFGIKGGTVPTPSIDRLFGEGIELTNFMVNPVCSPTRAALLTGRSAGRIGIIDALNNRQGEHLLLEETTLAETFRRASYKTAAYGKWHLGVGPFPGLALKVDSGPLAQGFDVFFGTYGSGADYLYRSGTPNATGEHNMIVDENAMIPTDERYATDIFAEKAVNYIAANKASPFFLYLPFNATHEPIPLPSDPRKDPYLPMVPASIVGDGPRGYAALVIGLDAAIGRVMKALADAGVDENTIVVMFSDNGAPKNGSAGPFRGSKHTFYEGGIHSPAVIRWTGKIGAGKKMDRLVGAEDLYKTLLSLSGNPVPANPPEYPLDGVDFSYNVAVDQSKPTRDWYAWTFGGDPMSPVYPRFAIRTEQHKLLQEKDGSWLLFDLKADPGEKTDLYMSDVAVRDMLAATLSAWRATLPPPNANPT